LGGAGREFGIGVEIVFDTVAEKNRYPNTFCAWSKMGWRATKRCPGSASESAAETFSLAATGFTPLNIGAAVAELRRNYESAISGNTGIQRRTGVRRASAPRIGVWEFPAHFGNAQMWKTKGIPPLRSRPFHE
jgi:hypothetical protein